MLKNPQPSTSVLSWWKIGLILVVIAFAFQGTRSLWEPDEGFYVGTAFEMFQSGDYLIPRLNEEPFLDKPPMVYWGIAAGLKLLGQNEWGARLFHALCFIGTGGLVFLFAKDLFGDSRRAAGAMLVYATMMLPVGGAYVVTPDTPLVFWTTLAIYCFWRSMRDDGSYDRLWQMAMCAAFGFGFLTKGPAALIPAGALGVFLIVRREFWRYFLTGWIVPGVAIFLLVGFSWYVWVSKSLPGAASYFWDNQVVGRTVSAKYARNPGLLKAFIVYPPALFFGALPWCLLWFRGIKGRARWFFSRAGWKRMADEDRTSLLLTLWILVPLVVLSAAQSRLILYCLPLFPAIALATARLLPLEWFEISSNPSTGWRLIGRPQIAMVLWVLVLVGVKGGATLVDSKKVTRNLWDKIDDHLTAIPYEIVVVDDQVSGLHFYGASEVEQVTLEDEPYPFYAIPEALVDEIIEMQTIDSRVQHLILCRRDRRADYIEDKLTEAGILFDRKDLPNEWKLVVCQAKSI